ncbi:hypothetical protein [Kineococcus aurantiacus]|uniref:Uncharacterized protein n=1 Tax=Kineococcus aurantiacus TaxID=37633 RepID=A0A7Y9DJW6_9ACTN|nr:hypothetical protein [Kineococcus aurantiacus]NYD21940.1 hypothetical protein [Kineococcus aurantiacus]
MSVATDRPVRGYRLAVPAWWDRVDLTAPEPERQRVVTDLVARQFRGRDDAPLARRDVTRLLLEQVRHAHEVGGLELHLSARAVAGVVVPVSLLVHALPADAVHAEPGFETWTTGAGTGVRRRREQHLDGGPEGPVATTVVEHRVPAPVAAGTWLALTTSTVSGPLADPVAGLADAVAATLRWVA